METVVRSTGTSVELNKLMRNVYGSLSIIIAIAALTSYLAVSTGFSGLPWWGTLIAFYGLLFGITKTQDSVLGLGLTALLAAAMGANLAPLLNHAIGSGQGHLITYAFAGTAISFGSISLYVLKSKKDFSAMGSFLFGGMIAAIALGLIGMLAQIPMLSLAVTAMVMLLSLGLVAYETSGMVHNPNQNYIMVTVGLFVTIYNLFSTMLHLLMSFANDD